MSKLKPEKLHVRFLSGSTPQGPLIPRRYTLTHSDRTGDLFLTIGPDYDRKQVGGLYTKLFRDEALAEWKQEQGALSLHVYVHVSGGFVIGSAAWRNRILRKEMPLVLESIRYGDDLLFVQDKKLALTPVEVHFQSPSPKYNRIESYGKIGDYTAK